ncbi:hypothetical protein SAMN05216389_103230 [Oceanobacillus limi]|uniref:Uncharacterized protein n=1 Tax=Oceanobacillus limi TaxID=930131 RepID=A0A1I0AG23_9BACI|nr:hypothetical protein [Oceanobacillus limi]SES93121.1 hypothetical protein SAMN05216389_103230 [Oceanobacillus limi]
MDSLVLIILALILLIIGLKVAKKIIKIILFLAVIGVAFYLLQDFLM